MPSKWAWLSDVLLAVSDLLKIIALWLKPY